MKWKEFIYVKTFDEDMKRRAVQAAVELNLSFPDDAPDSIEVLDGNNLDTEVLILVDWQTGRGKTAKTAIGVALVRLFSEFGWVSHSVWESRKTFDRKSWNRESYEEKKENHRAHMF